MSVIQSYTAYFYFSNMKLLVVTFLFVLFNCAFCYDNEVDKLGKTIVPLLGRLKNEYTEISKIIQSIVEKLTFLKIKSKENLEEVRSETYSDTSSPLETIKSYIQFIEPELQKTDDLRLYAQEVLHSILQYDLCEARESACTKLFSDLLKSAQDLVNSFKKFKSKFDFSEGKVSNFPESDEAGKILNEILEIGNDIYKLEVSS